jgi:ABC-type branched-subunit amino acid transport system substrate-binding protein
VLSTRPRFASVALITAILLVACGQKPGVHIATRSGEGAATGEGEVPAGEEGAGLAAGEQTGGGTTAAAGGGGASKAGGSSSTGALVGGAANRTGITDTEIKVGLHAPVTGAAPFPAENFRRGQDVYWSPKWSGAPKIFGRTVKIVFENDDYNPFTAVDKCRKMAEQDKVFLIIGGGGTDQVQACSRWAASKGVPYVSAGVTEIGMRNLKTYFAFTMSYKQQAPLLWQMIVSDPRLDENAVAMVRTNTPNFEDAHQAFVQAVQASGKTLVLDRTMSKNPSQTEYQQTALALRNANATTVFILTAPLHYIQLTARLDPAYRPWWVGVGITKGLNDVLSNGCRTSANAIGQGLFFSPGPGLDIINELDPNYNRAYRAVNGSEGDDLGMLLWALNKSLHGLFENAGKDLSRQSFIVSTEKASISTGIFPPVQYTLQNHFGATQVHLLKANCSTLRYDTEARFKSSFP